MAIVDLPTQCESSDTITIDIPSTKFQKSFKKDPTTSILRGARATKTSSEYAIWNGMDTSDGSTFCFVQDTKGEMSGSMVDLTQGMVYQIRKENGGSYFVTATKSSDFPPEAADPIDSSDFPPEADPIDDLNRKRKVESRTDTSNVSENTATTKSAPSAIVPKLNFDTASSRKLYDDDGGNMDIMVLWTTAAECEASGLSTGCTLTSSTESTMRLLVELSVAETNTAFSSSGIESELLLVHAYRHPSHVEGSITNYYSSMRDDLWALRGGAISDVHANRSIYGADIVGMISAYDEETAQCGLGYSPSISYMFFVTNVVCATGNYSFGHAVGDTFGINGDRGSEDACSYPFYNWGYREPNAKWRTLMADDCVAGECDNNPGGGCPRINRYSTPNYYYNGDPLGTSGANAAQQINDVRVEVAGFYPHGGAGTPSPTPGPPTPTTTNNDCVDFGNRIRFDIGNGSKISRSCEWAGNKSTTQRCAYDGVSEACPLTCGTCDSCVDTPSSLRFKFQKDGEMVTRSCDWVTRKQTAARCTQTDNICRAACGVC